MFGRWGCCGRHQQNMCCDRQMEQQIMEPTMTKCIEKEFYHEVPQE